MRTNIPQNQKGFLLIDVLIGMVILAVALIAVAGMFIQSSKASRLSPKYTIAADLAQKRIENLKTSDWGYLTKSSNFTGTEDSTPEYNPNNHNDEYYITVKVPQTRTDLDSNQNILELEVDVRFTDLQGKNITKRFIALYTNPG